MNRQAPLEITEQDMDRDAYNAAFFELGLRWHWDGSTYEHLVRRSGDPAERIRHYLETRQPHLLKAYDADFLAGVIQDRKAAHRRRAAPAGAQPAGRRFDWSRALDGEVGI